MSQKNKSKLKGKVTKQKKGSAPKASKLPGFPVVGIGASAGGLEALKELIENLEPNIQIACVVVQHLDPSHESYLSEILSKQTKMKVGEAKEGVKIEVGNIYTIPPNTSLVVSEGALRLSRRKEARDGLFLPVNEFFNSLAKSYGYRAIGVVLSGTGSDGTLGIEAIKEVGGTTFCQDKESAKFDSMPFNAIATGDVWISS